MAALLRALTLSLAVPALSTFFGPGRLLFSLCPRLVYSFVLVRRGVGPGFQLEYTRANARAHRCEASHLLAIFPFWSKTTRSRRYASRYFANARGHSRTNAREFFSTYCQGPRFNVRLTERCGTCVICYFDVFRVGISWKNLEKLRERCEFGISFSIGVEWVVCAKMWSVYSLLV